MTDQSSAVQRLRILDGKRESGVNGVTGIATKHELCLFDLLEAKSKGISKLTVLPSYGETCLPTTISELGASGFKIARERRTHTHRHGGKTFFTWYWFPSRPEAEKALNRVNYLRTSRGAEPISEILALDWLTQFPCRENSGGAA